MITVTTRSAMFHPPVDSKGGKWHATAGVDRIPLCGATVEVTMDFNTMILIRPRTDVTTVHPIVCRNCLAKVPTMQVDAP